MLESPSVLKIMHAATCDAQSVYRGGVRMWNIFDTAGQTILIFLPRSQKRSIKAHSVTFQSMILFSVAYKVLNFQRQGLAMYSSQQISFNNLCQVFTIH